MIASTSKAAVVAKSLVFDKSCVVVYKLQYALCLFWFAIASFGVVCKVGKGYGYSLEFVFVQMYFWIIRNCAEQRGRRAVGVGKCAWCCCHSQVPLRELDYLSMLWRLYRRTSRAAYYVNLGGFKSQVQKVQRDAA